MSYWAHVLTFALGVTLFVGGLNASGSLVVPVTLVGAALTAWGLFEGIETAVRRGTRDEESPSE